MIKPILLTTFISLYALAGIAKDSTAPALHAPCAFTENKGQVTDQDHVPRADIQFKVAAAHGLNIFIGDGAIHYQFSRLNACGEAGGARLGIHRHEARAHTATADMYRMDVELVGANPQAQVTTEEKQDYYEGHTATGSKNTATAYTYNKITYANIYPHIDWVLQIHNGQLKHEFVVHEGGNVADIQVRYGGATALQLNNDGSLAAATPQGVITEQAPVSYDADGQVVKSSFKLTGNVLTYETASYRGELTIDPSLIWATYYGGPDDDGASGVASDAAGNVYISGGTASISGIATSGAYQSTIGGGEDAFLAKFNSAGAILWATYYGGTDYDEGQGVATDAAGNIYMAGAATSLSGGTADVFLAKFNSAGTLQWVENYGGSNEDVGLGVATDNLGYVYVTGWSISAYGMGTSGSYQAVLIGGADAFLTKFNSTTGATQWSTYYGGSGDDYGNGVATDAAGNVYITGNTTSTSGIATGTAYQGALGGSADAFLVKFNSAGARQWATYYGGTGADAANAITWADSVDMYIAGVTGSAGMATAGSYKDTISGTSDAFLAKFSDAGALQWATYYGGDSTDGAYGVGTDSSRNVYITGKTASATGIATPGAYQDTLGGGIDAFVAKFSTAGVGMGSTYFGGNEEDDAYAIAGVGAANVYVAGNTLSTAGIATAGANQTVFGGVSDAFLGRFYICLTPVVGALTGGTSVCAGSTITLADTTAGGVWSVINSTASVSGGIVMGATAGADTIVYAKTNSCGVATTTYTVTINPLPDAGTITGDDTVCIGTTITLADAVTGGAWAASNAKAGVAAGVVTGMAAGTDTIKYSITATCTGVAQKIIHIIHCQTAVNSVAMPGEEASIYPNPATDNITIAATVPLDKVVICNEVGQVVFSGAYQTNSAVVSLARLPVGVYMVRINDRNVYKVVRQ